MAKQEIVTFSYTCDVCGREVPVDERDGAAREVSFGGRSYEIDLCKKDAAGLDKAIASLQSYLDAGRRAGSLNGAGRHRRPIPAPRSRAQAATRSGGAKGLREWAHANGWPNLGDRGRVPAEVQQAYQAANG